jgi:hypothetical protein
MASHAGCAWLRKYRIVVSAHEELDSKRIMIWMWIGYGTLLDLEDNTMEHK